MPCLDAVAHGGNPQDRAASLSGIGLPLALMVKLWCLLYLMKPGI
ncbi:MULTISPECIES: hypothetical protein [unclassified Moorena]|nr:MULTISPECIES: hypothetical protein [unclassified Moorena]